MLLVLGQMKVYRRCSSLNSHQLSISLVSTKGTPSKFNARNFWGTDGSIALDYRPSEGLIFLPLTNQKSGPALACASPLLCWDRQRRGTLGSFPQCLFCLYFLAYFFLEWCKYPELTKMTLVLFHQLLAALIPRKNPT